MDKNDNIPEISANVPQKKFPWTIINGLVVIFTFVGCCGSLITTLGVTLPLVCIEILLNIFLVLFYREWLEHRKYRKTVTALRLSAIAVIVLVISIPNIATDSDLNYEKSMYQVKRFIYSHSFYNRYLPTKLPKVCEDYKFVTQVSIPAQDYHPSAYLIFRTDTATMQELEEAYKQIDDAELLEIEDAPDIEEYKQEYGDDYIEYMPQCPNEIPAHVYARLDDDHIENFFDAVIYEVPSYYSKGCIFDYDSGLVVYWT